MPDNLVPVQSFEPVFGAEACKKFTESTGIREMYKALPEETAGDLAHAAADNLFEKTETDRSKIGALVFVTQSPDYRRPATACVLQKRLGLSLGRAAMDIGLGCSGFVYGLQTAALFDGLIRYGVCACADRETASKLVNPLDKSIVMMYGDAGAAILLKREEGASTKNL